MRATISVRPVTNYFSAFAVRQILLQVSENSFRPNYRHMLQMLRQTMEVKLQVIAALCMT
jgi:hypothetical protein